MLRCCHKKRNFCLVGGKRFFAQTKVRPQLTNLQNFYLLRVLDESQLRLDCKVCFLIYSNNNDRRNAVKNFFERYQLAALNKNFTRLRGSALEAILLCK